MFRRKAPFDEIYVRDVPPDPGVYIVYELTGQPIYVGRSGTSIRSRLQAHLRRRGNKNISLALSYGVPLQFEYELMNSAEQAEAILIQELGTRQFYNLRRETDPADWG